MFTALKVDLGMAMPCRQGIADPLRHGMDPDVCVEEGRCVDAAQVVEPYPTKAEQTGLAGKLL